MSYLDPSQLAGVNGLNAGDGWSWYDKAAYALHLDKAASYISKAISGGGPCSKWEGDASYAGKLALKSCMDHLKVMPDDSSGARKSGELMYQEAIAPCKEWHGHTGDENVHAFSVCSRHLRANPKDLDGAHRAGLRAYQQIMAEKAAMRRPPAPQSLPAHSDPCKQWEGMRNEAERQAFAACSSMYQSTYNAGLAHGVGLSTIASAAEAQKARMAATGFVRPKTAPRPAPTIPGAAAPMAPTSLPKATLIRPTAPTPVRSQPQPAPPPQQREGQYSPSDYAAAIRAVMDEGDAARKKETSSVMKGVLIVGGVAVGVLALAAIGRSLVGGRRTA